METARHADGDNAAALAALSADGPGRIALVAPTRPGMSPCPHCREAFGSASLSIHVKRCRALLPDPEAEVAAAEAAAVAAKSVKKLKKLQVPALVDLCLRFVTRNFQAVCMDKVMAAPEHEAYLIDSLPTGLVHRIITNLVYENRKISERDDQQRTKLRELKRELDEVKTQKGQLEAFRSQAAVFRSRLTDQDMLIETMRREAEITKNELASARQQNLQLETRFTGMNMSQLRLDNRINNLFADNEKLKGEVRAVRKKEMEAIKLLASAAKSGKPIDQARAIALQASVPRELPNARSNKRRAATEKRIVKPRPRTEGSKIPFPSHLPDSSVRSKKRNLISPVVKEVAAMSLGLLPRTGAFVSEAMRCEEEKLLEHRLILSEVHHVLDEMVYDVETCEHECEVSRLKHELEVAKSSIVDYQQRESVLIQERQQAFEYATTVEQEAKAMMHRVEEQLAVVVAELLKKDALEKELTMAREQLHLSAQLSKELANAQREIRELHRKNSIQKLLKTSNVSAKGYSNGGTRPFKIERAASVSSVSSASRSNQPPSPVSNQLDAVDGDPFVRCPDKELMNVFAHLDANSVFVVSLTSRTLMTRVHTLFGMPPNSIMAKRAKSPETPTPALPSPSPAPASSSALKQGVLKTRSQSSASFIGDKGRSQLAKAEMIVKSLKKDEIKLFHDMSTRVRTLETHLSQVQAEKEDIAARLHSAESVRDFLMEKLKELEDRLSIMMEAAAKKDEQNTMDREIIGFLDARIHEYELTVKRLTTQHDEIAVELNRVRHDHASKLTIVQDMVDLLSDEKKDLDTQLKTQRKVLVREVKALRVQNQQLTHDKERYFTQLKQLRVALQHLDDLS